MEAAEFKVIESCAPLVQLERCSFYNYPAFICAAATATSRPNPNMGPNRLVTCSVQNSEITYKHTHLVAGVNTRSHTYASQSPTVENTLYFVTYSTGNTGSVGFCASFFPRTGV